MELVYEKVSPLRLFHLYILLVTFLWFRGYFFLFVFPYSVSDPSAFRFLIYINPLCVFYMNGFSTLIPFPLLFNNSYTEVVLSLHFLSEVYFIFFLFSLSLYCGPMDLLEVASFVVLHGCGAYTLSDFSAL